MLNKELWDKCVAFHGHECPGLSIGYRAALYAAKLLDLCFSEDEDVVCISENDACGVDAIQVILGCSAGKGNLLFHVVGKQAFSVYERKSGRSVRLVLKAMPECRGRKALNICIHSQMKPYSTLSPLSWSCPKERQCSAQLPVPSAGK